MLMLPTIVVSAVAKQPMVHPVPRQNWSMLTLPDLDFGLDRVVEWKDLCGEHETRVPIEEIEPNVDSFEDSPEVVFRSLRKKRDGQRWVGKKGQSYHQQLKACEELEKLDQMSDHELWCVFILQKHSSVCCAGCKVVKPWEEKKRRQTKRDNIHVAVNDLVFKARKGESFVKAESVSDDME